MTDSTLETLLRRDRLIVAGALGIVVALAWGYVLWLANDMDMGGMDMTGFRMIPAGISIVMPATLSRSGRPGRSNSLIKWSWRLAERDRGQSQQKARHGPTTLRDCDGHKNTSLPAGEPVSRFSVRGSIPRDMVKSAYFIKTQLRRFLRFRLVISKVLSRILQVSPSWTILPALLVACILFLPQNQKAGSHPGQYQRAS